MRFSAPVPPTLFARARVHAATPPRPCVSLRPCSTIPSSALVPSSWYPETTVKHCVMCFSPPPPPILRHAHLSPPTEIPFTDTTPTLLIVKRTVRCIHAQALSNNKRIKKTSRRPSFLHRAGSVVGHHGHALALARRAQPERPRVEGRQEHLVACLGPRPFAYLISAPRWKATTRPSALVPERSGGRAAD